MVLFPYEKCYYIFLGGYGWKSGKLLKPAGSRKYINAGSSNNSQGIISIIDNFINFKIAKIYTAI